MKGATICEGRKGLEGKCDTLHKTWVSSLSMGSKLKEIFTFEINDNFAMEIITPPMQGTVENPTHVPKEHSSFMGERTHGI